MDVHIRGERVFPLCEVLDDQGVPVRPDQRLCRLGHARQMAGAAAAAESPTRSTRSQSALEDLLAQRGQAT